MHPESQVPATNINRDSIVHWSAKPVFTAVGEEVVLMNLERGRCYGLGEVGTDVWKRLSAPVRVADLVDQLALEYTAELKVLEQDVLEVLGQYADEGLIVVS